MITAIVLYDLPNTIGLEECREHFTRIAPDFLKALASSGSSLSAEKKVTSPAAFICGKARPPLKLSTAARGARGFARVMGTIPGYNISKP
jgi:hypothetical protein